MTVAETTSDTRQMAALDHAVRRALREHPIHSRKLEDLRTYCAEHRIARRRADADADVERALLALCEAQL